MGTNTKLSPELISRLQTICREAISRPEGLRLEFESEFEAVKFRMRIYIARKALRKVNTGDTSPVCMVEMKLDGKTLRVYAQEASILGVKILDEASREEVKIETSAEEFMEERHRLLPLSENAKLFLEGEIADKVTIAFYPNDFNAADFAVQKRLAEQRTKKVFDQFIAFGWNETMDVLEFAHKHNLVPVKIG